MTRPTLLVKTSRTCRTTLRSMKTLIRERSLVRLRPRMLTFRQSIR